MAAPSAIAEYAAAKAALLSGDIDLIVWVDMADWPSLLNTPGIKTSDNTTFDAADYLCLNSQREPMNNPLFRKAVHLSLDKQQFVDVCFNGAGGPMCVPMDSKDPFYNPEWEKINPHDLIQAQEIPRKKPMKNYCKDLDLQKMQLLLKKILLEYQLMQVL